MEDRRIVIITQARVGSTRLPAKVTLPINGTSLLAFHLKRLKQVQSADALVVATTHEAGVEQLLDIARQCDVPYYQGDTNDVLDRFYQAAKATNADIVVRVTSDCPLIDPELIDSVIAFMLQSSSNYCANILKEEFPDGQDIEVMTFKALEQAWKDANLKSDREHVTPYIRRNSSFNGGNLFTSENYDATQNRNHLRMTVDEKEDLNAIITLVNEVGENKSWLEYAVFIENNPSKFTNQRIIRNEGYQKSVEKDKNNK